MKDPCPINHEAAKLDELLWSSFPHVGVQHVEACEDYPAYDLVLRNCPRCHTTLAREIVPAQEAA